MLIWLASYPRSGNSFLRILLQKLYGTPSWSIYEEVDSAGLRIRPQELPFLRHSNVLHFVKTHELPDDDSPAILLVRDGRDAMVSYAHYARECEPARVPTFRESLRNLHDRLIHNVSGFDQTLRDTIIGHRFHWSRHYTAWTGRQAPTTVIRFEDLIQDPVAHVDEAMSRLLVDLPRRGSTPPTFAELHRTNPQLFRRGVVGQWCDEMREDLQALFWATHRTVMEEAGYA